MPASMEQFVVSAPAAAATKKRRISHSDETIAKAVKEARQLGPAAAAHAVNKDVTMSA